jgi:cytochrome c biogenesis protein CcdA
MSAETKIVETKEEKLRLREFILISLSVILWATLIFGSPLLIAYFIPSSFADNHGTLNIIGHMIMTIYYLVIFSFIFVVALLYVLEKIAKNFTKWVDGRIEKFKSVKQGEIKQ